jgi:D-amino-acid oxidase
MATFDSSSLVVLGTGISGMTTALCLAEAGIDVRIVADRPHELTVSATAGALWGPYVSEDPRVLRWSLDSLSDLVSISKDKSSGVQLARGIEAARTAATPPTWLQELEDFTLCTPEKLPSGYESGWSYSAPIFDMPTYLAYLEGRLTMAEVHIDILEKPIGSLAGLCSPGSILVNCTGLGSRTLVPDSSVSSAWGQLVIVENPGIEGFFSDYPESKEPTYFIAHQDHVVLGGHVDHERTELRPDDEIAERIRTRCNDAEPRLRQSRVIGCRVGLRPVRSRVRLEREERDGTLIIHNYGHGGSGVTLSWGCARRVVDLISH